jgi:Xaa-Pro aminopeptidase
MKSKVEQALSILKEKDIECWIILEREQRDKAIELLLGQGFIGESAFILTRGKKIAVVASYDKARVQDMEVHTYTKGIRDVLPEILREVNPSRIYMNFSQYDHTVDSLTYGSFLKFSEILKEIHYKGEILSSEVFLEDLRSVKTREEMDRIREAVRVTEEIFDEMPTMVHEKITERELMQKMVDLTRRKGCELAWSDPAVSFGLGTELGHRMPSDRKLRRNESIHIDFGVKYEGYCSDLQRVFFFGGEPPEKMVRGFETIQRAQEESVKAITPGKKGYEIDAVARKIITESGYPEYNHGLGHQIGREVHDGGCILGPLWERYEKSAVKEIKKGNIFTIEPSITGEVNMGLEDDIVVKEKAELLSHPQKEIIVI